MPVNTKVRLLVTAADVLHAWWMPAFGVKQDAIPGYINEAWFNAETEGTYRGQCAELCGMDHGFMPIVVRVTSRDEYNTWLNVAANSDELARLGNDFDFRPRARTRERHKEDLA